MTRAAGGEIAPAGVDHLARDVAAGNVRQRQLHVLEPAPLPEVQVIQRARADAHQGLPGTRRRIGHLEELQHLGLKKSEQT